MNDYTSGFMFVDLFETHICNEVYNRTEYDLLQIQFILKRFLFYLTKYYCKSRLIIS